MMAGSDGEKAQRLGRRMAEAAGEIYGETDPATLVALSCVGLKAYARAAQALLDEKEAAVVSRMVGSAQGRADALNPMAKTWAPLSPGGREGDGATPRRDSTVSALGRDSTGSLYDGDRRDSLGFEVAAANNAPVARRLSGGMSPRTITVQKGSSSEESKEVDTSPKLLGGDHRRPSIGRNVLTGRGSNVALTDDDRELLRLFDRMCESDERFAVEALLDQRSGSSLDPQLSIERRIKIAERALATGRPEGEETAAERGKRFSLGFSAVVRDQRALETIPRMDSKASMRSKAVMNNMPGDDA